MKLSTTTLMAIVLAVPALALPRVSVNARLAEPQPIDLQDDADAVFAAWGKRSEEAADADDVFAAWGKRSAE